MNEDTTTTDASLAQVDRGSLEFTTATHASTMPVTLMPPPAPYAEPVTSDHSILNAVLHGYIS